SLSSFHSFIGSAARQFRESRHKKRLMNFVIDSFTHNAKLSCYQRTMSLSAMRHNHKTILEPIQPHVGSQA
ncbi:hypothetical protein ABMX80_22875, partial [Vibrio vulnificus]|uniref:hypothetical protein n=1 Tax=Vibrio vulnificus TaxID=672 RepID=UPI00405991D9